MVTWEHEPASFDAVVLLYALIHLPLEDQQGLLAKIRLWLRPGGYLLAIVGSQRWTGIEDYFGAAMFWDHADRDTYLAWLKAADPRRSGIASCPKATQVIRSCWRRRLAPTRLALREHVNANRQQDERHEVRLHDIRQL
jgi:hypothetical protein